MKQEQRLIEAIMQRDRRYDGLVYYGVTTTGIYCRPSCPSRRPLLKNLRLFRDASEALAAGFRPCRRCQPELRLSSDSQYVIDSCRLMAEAVDGPLSMVELAEKVGLSERHLRELFMRHLGVSPHQFYNSVRIQRLREGLARGEDVTSAIYAAGFNSPSRVYADVGQKLGMAPSSYRNGGRGQAIKYAILPSPQGYVLVAGTERGLSCVQLGDEPQALLAQLQEQFPAATLSTHGGRVQQWARALVDYLAGQGRWPLLPLDLHATAFQARVWQLLREIPEGKTLTYKEIARKLGLPAGARAVARACASNPLALAVPCHRAVRQDGQDTAFRWGRQRKRALLQHEREQSEGKEKE